MDYPPFLRFHPVPLRTRHDGWTAELQFRFILLLARGYGPSEAARQLGKSRQTAYDLRKKPGAESFAAAWDAAQAFAREARFAGSALPRGQFGLETVLVPRFYRGRLVGFVQREDHKGALRLLGQLDRISDRFESGVATSDFEGLLDLIDPGGSKPGKTDAISVRARPPRQFPNGAIGAKGAPC
jgi:Homeodomain-like domain